MSELIKNNIIISYHFRKSYEIKIQDNIVLLKVPHLTTELQINELLLRKKRWINSRLKNNINNQYQNQEDKVFLFGKLIDRPAGDLNKFYQQELSQYILSRINTISEQIGVKATNLTIRAMTTRWGSCTSAKRITVNLYLAKAPYEVIDYVLTHELCHIKHMNHSILFWSLVAKHSPEYKTYKKWLRIHGSTIMQNN
jgi:predicted metal-dependent hydrolase